MPNKTYITEGGLKQAWTERRKAEREVKGTGMGRILRWNRKALLNYTQCRAGKGRLGMWRYTLDPYLQCGRIPRTGNWQTCGAGMHVGGREESVDEQGEGWGQRGDHRFGGRVLYQVDSLNMAFCLVCVSRGGSERVYEVAG